MNSRKRILMVAAENDTLPGAKVGGVGDVIRDLPRSLIKLDVDVDTVIPSYGFLSRIEGLESRGYIYVSFASRLYKAEVLKQKGVEGNSDNYIIHHEEFCKHGESVYLNDEEAGPFAQDATKFAFFNACIAEALIKEVIPKPDVLHCHDWHAAFIFILIKYAPEYRTLQNICRVFTIHNIAMQGIRPLQEDDSSFSEWFPNLPCHLNILADPRYRDCINPMRAGILLADKVSTVSPTYAKEILKPTQPELGFYGGEGLEKDLVEREKRGELYGILNGCEYPNKQSALSKSDLGALMQNSLERWVARSQVVSGPHWLAEKRIASWLSQPERGLVVTSVGRLTDQKAQLLQVVLKDGRTVLECLMDLLGDSGTLIMLGSGDKKLEMFCAEATTYRDNLIFLNGYSSALADAVYQFGDLFLMPSSFEPCGISQMLAMRAGQPCIVNGVGGLKDTIEHLKTGFIFHGNNVESQAEALVTLFAKVVNLYKQDAERLAKISKAAKQQRFTWKQAAQEYLEKLYS